nr:unnamed protein product [Digitaria exilis]
MEVLGAKGGFGGSDFCCDVRVWEGNHDGEEEAARESATEAAPPPASSAKRRGGLAACLSRAAPRRAAGLCSPAGLLPAPLGSAACPVPPGAAVSPCRLPRARDCGRRVDRGPCTTED